MKKTYDISGSFLYEEKQHFPRWFKGVLALLLGSGLVITIVSLLAASSGGDAADIREAVMVLVFVIFINAFTYFLIVTMKLEKVVTSNGIYYRWLPYQKRYRHLEKTELASFEVRKSPAMSYGAKWAPGYGKTHNLSDGKGLQFHLNTGKKIFFGTADIDAFHQAVDRMMKNHVH